jgi:hypothetical protein
LWLELDAGTFDSVEFHSRTHVVRVDFHLWTAPEPRLRVDQLRLAGIGSYRIRDVRVRVARSRFHLRNGSLAGTAGRGSVNSRGAGGKNAGIPARRVGHQAAHRQDCPWHGETAEASTQQRADLPLCWLLSCPAI